jgi:hypothetical protein
VTTLHTDDSPKMLRDARWAVCNVEGIDPADPVARWHACRRRLHGALSSGTWEADHVRIYDLIEPVSRS